MCGITGFWGANHQQSVAEKMVEQIRHRGPDDLGCWGSIKDGLALAHTRLSIVDLSTNGAQPMISKCGRFVIVFNGEIYNHNDLRKQIELEVSPTQWQGTSDTETLLAGFSCWGFQKCLLKLVGMFAFALWDNQEKTLVLARDRMGEKPLYYGQAGDTFLFGSELKSLQVFPDWKGKINRDVLALFFRFGYVPAPWSIYEDIFKLPPAHFLIIKDNGRDIGDPICYWDLNKIACDEVEMRNDSAIQLADKLEILLLDSVKRQMSADVPLGSFLSGGYDSSTVTALMQAQSERPIKTFTIGFKESNYNEASHARRVANHLGTQHTELFVTPYDAINTIPALPDIYDEPFADTSQIPTYLVSKLARKDVTVCLSGDGGDELFCGYNRYIKGYNIWNKLRNFPQPTRKVLSSLLNTVPAHIFERLQSVLPLQLQVSSLAEKIPKLADALTYSDVNSYYKSLISHSKNPTEIVLGSIDLEKSMNRPGDKSISRMQEQMMYWDMINYLPDGILTKVDRASMSLGLEARVPLLDHNIVEFAWKVPNDFKYRDGQGKWLLRQVLYRHIPKELMDRPKMGFSLPIADWLRGPLREWAEMLLDESRMRNEGYLNSDIIRTMWLEHISGKKNWQHPLWDVLMFQAWLEGQLH